MTAQPERTFECVIVKLSNAFTGEECGIFPVDCDTTKTPSDEEEAHMVRCNVLRIIRSMWDNIWGNFDNVLIKHIMESDRRRGLTRLFTFLLPGSEEPLTSGTDLTKYLVREDGRYTLTLNVIKNN
jgi:hypothetical protein